MRGNRERKGGVGERRREAKNKNEKRRKDERRLLLSILPRKERREKG